MDHVFFAFAKVPPQVQYKRGPSWSFGIGGWRGLIAPSTRLRRLVPKKPDTVQP